MHWFDVSVIVLLLVSTIYSLIRGLIKEFFSLAAFIIAFILAHRYYSLISTHISGFIANNIVSDLLSFGFIFILSVLTISQIGKFVRKLIYKAKTLSFTDRVAGGFLGLAKGLLIIMVIMIPIGLIPSAKKEILFKSKLAPHILNFSKELSKISFSDNNILKSFQNKIKLPELSDKLKIGLEALKGSSRDRDGGKKGVEHPNKNNVPFSDNITEEDKEKLRKLIDKNL